MSFSKRGILFQSICSFLFLIASIQFVWATATSPALKSTNIILLTIDTLRPDHLGCYGYKSIKTPNIDSLAKKGTLFTNAYSPVPLTLPSHVSILTGQYPVTHGVHNNGTFVLSDSADTLAEILHNHGYKTGAVVASHVLASQFGLGKGFDYYDDHLNGVKGDKEVMPKDHVSYRQGESVTDLATKWLKQNHKGPFFLWVHYFDPHSPYDPPPPFDNEYESRPYDGEIAYLDQCLGRLFDEMRELGILKNTHIFFVGDHGEGLWEHGEQSHGLFIYDTTLRVPLIVCSLNNQQKGKKITSLVSTIDLMPTILESVDIKLEKSSIQGVSLIPFLKGKKKDLHLNLYCGSRYPELNFNWAPLEGIVTSEGWKYILAPKPELYDLINDPQEKTNLYAVNHTKAESLQKKLVNLKRNLSLKSPLQEEAKQISLSPETREKLRSLGYVWSGKSKENKVKDQTTHSLPDPKDMAPLLAQIDKARELSMKGKISQAIQAYEKVLIQDPDNIMARYDLGLAYRSGGEFKKAVSEFEKMIKIDPQYFDCQNILGLLYDQLCLPQKAISAYQEALKINPGHVQVHNNLGMVYLKMNNLDLAVQEFQQTLSKSKDPIITSLAQGNLGRVYRMQGYLEMAIKKFKRSIKLNSANREVYIDLADTYHRLGDIDQTIQEWERIVKLWPDDYFSCYRLAQLFLTAGKSDMAVQYLRKALQLRPDYIEARRLLQQMT